MDLTSFTCFLKMTMELKKSSYWERRCYDDHVQEQTLNVGVMMIIVIVMFSHRPKTGIFERHWNYRFSSLLQSKWVFSALNTITYS